MSLPNKALKTLLKEIDSEKRCYFDEAKVGVEFYGIRPLKWFALLGVVEQLIQERDEYKKRWQEDRCKCDNYDCL